MLNTKNVRRVASVLDDFDDDIMEVKKLCRPKARHLSPAWLGPKPIHTKVPGVQPVHLKQNFNAVDTIVTGTVTHEAQVHALRDNTGGIVNWMRSHRTPEAVSRTGRL